MLSCFNARAWAAYIDVLTSAERLGGREGDTCVSFVSHVSVDVSHASVHSRERDPLLVKLSLKIEDNNV